MHCCNHGYNNDYNNDYNNVYNVEMLENAGIFPSQKAVTLDRNWKTLTEIVLTVLLESTVLEEPPNLVQPVQKGKHQ